MSGSTDDRLAFLMKGPALATRQGCRERVGRLGLRDLFVLTFTFDCKVDDVDKKLWERNCPWRKGREHGQEKAKHTQKAN